MPKNWIRTTFGTPRAVLGVLHLPPLPGSPRPGPPVAGLWERVRGEAEIYRAHGIHGLLLENHGDAPFVKDSNEPHVPALLGVLASRLRETFDVPIGVNVLRNDAHGALAAAAAAEAAFIRVNVLTGVTATDQGLIEGRADDLLRYRARIAPDVAILADVNVKYGTPLYAPPFPTLCRATLERALADALIVTGAATGAATSLETLREAKESVGDAAVIAGSGVTEETLADTLAVCDAVIVGSALKIDGYVENDVDAARVERFMRVVHRM